MMTTSKGVVISTAIVERRLATRCRLEARPELGAEGIIGAVLASAAMV
jgi:hypothetical protein